MTAGQRWGKGKPKKAGWYWLRYLGRVQCLEVYMDKPIEVPSLGLMCEYGPVGRVSGEWQGPITPHDQEAG